MKTLKEVRAAIKALAIKAELTDEESKELEELRNSKANLQSKRKLPRRLHRSKQKKKPKQRRPNRSASTLR